MARVLFFVVRPRVFRRRDQHSTADLVRRGVFVAAPVPRHAPQFSPGASVVIFAVGVVVGVLSKACVR
jgi:hypothetical protein